jgi:hypothetical protein
MLMKRQAVKRKYQAPKKFYVFRPEGSDGDDHDGGIVELTAMQALRILLTVEKLANGGDAPFYLYEMDCLTPRQVQNIINGKK